MFLLSLAKKSFFHASPLCPLPVLNLFNGLFFDFGTSNWSDYPWVIQFLFCLHICCRTLAVVCRALVTQCWAMKSFLNDFTESVSDDGLLSIICAKSVRFINLNDIIRAEKSQPCWFPARFTALTVHECNSRVEQLLCYISLQSMCDNLHLLTPRLMWSSAPPVKSQMSFSTTRCVLKLISFKSST